LAEHHQYLVAVQNSSAYASIAFIVSLVHVSEVGIEIVRRRPQG
jgi:hypothetical protein